LTFVSETSKSIEVSYKFGLMKGKAAAKPDKLQTYIEKVPYIKDYLPEWLSATTPIIRDQKTIEPKRKHRPNYEHSLKTWTKRNQEAA